MQPMIGRAHGAIGPDGSIELQLGAPNDLQKDQYGIDRRR
jgi:hypothetical protein